MIPLQSTELAALLFRLLRSCFFKKMFKHLEFSGEQQIPFGLLICQNSNFRGEHCLQTTLVPPICQFHWDETSEIPFQRYSSFVDTGACIKTVAGSHVNLFTGT